MSLDDFDRLTPPELIAALEVSRRLRAEDWRRTQYIMWAAMRPHYKQLKPTDVLLLPGDQLKREKRQLTAEEEAQRQAKIRKMDARAAAEYEARKTKTTT